MRVLRRLWGMRARLYPVLDRPGVRGMLARIATMLARRETTDDVAIVHRGAWFGVVDGVAVPATGSRAFVYRHGNEIRSTLEWHLRDVDDTWLYAYTPRPGDVVVDVGAGIGSETYVFARAVGDTGRVLAIEPHPETFNVLSSQVALNGLANVTLEQCAVTARPMPVYIEDRERHERNTISGEWSEGRRRESVPGVPLDDLVRKHALTHIDFLKMNIEGAESDALLGMSETLAMTRRLCIACHDFLGLQTRDRVSATLRERGFVIESREDDSRPFVRDHLHAHRVASLQPSRGVAQPG